MQQHPSPSLSGAFEIVARGLPYLDRRVLSEAWYASLHIAQRECEPRPQPNGTRSTGLAPASGLRAAGKDAPPETLGAPIAGHVARVSRDLAPGLAPELAERRRPSLVLATRIARTFAPAVPRAAATFDIEHGGARVRVLMRNDGAGLRLIALCKPSLRATVVRALDEARFLLAARGVAVRSAQTKAERA